MKYPKSRMLFIGSLAIVAVGVVVAMLPVATGLSRAVVALSMIVGWFAVGAAVWNRYRPIGWVWMGMTLFVSVFLIMPGGDPSGAALDRAYVAALRQYEGSPYVWGGEKKSGIDCSGLVRCGAIDAQWREGLRSFNPSLVRASLLMWWHDASARHLGEGYDGWASEAIGRTSLNKADADQLRPGDFAITLDGVHALAYLGDRWWIEADPGAHRVLTFRTPATDNPWADRPVRVMRWWWATGGK